MVQDVRLRILLIEDNPGDARLIQEMLKLSPTLSHDLERADRLASGLVKLETESFDVLLLDLSLPDSQGLQTLERVTIAAPQVPVVVLTGLQDEGAGIEAVRLGAQDYLVKGQFQANLLSRAVLYAIERSRAQARRDLTVRILGRLNYPCQGYDAIEEILDMIREFGRFDTVGIRIRDGGDRPFVQIGFPEGFATCYEGGPTPAPETVCVCDMVLAGRTDAALSRFSPGGSFWRNRAQAPEPGAADGATRGPSLCLSGEFESVALIPLRSGAETVGLLQIHDRRPDRLSEDTVQFYEGVASSIGVALARGRAEDALRAMDFKMRFAREIQQGLFPLRAPDVPGFEIAGVTLPAEATGGDYYDYLPMPDGRLGIVVGDASGHGFGPALLMTETHAYLRALVTTCASLEQVMSTVDMLLSDDCKGGNFVTMTFLALDTVRRQLAYASAGHPPGYVLDGEGRLKAEISSTGFPLGLCPGVPYSVPPLVQLAPGDVVCVLTDGVIEGMAAPEAFFGVDRTLAVLRESRHETATVIINRLFAAVQDFCRGRAQPDDMTAVIIKVTEPGD